MSRILAFAGCKQAGKNTACNFLHGYQMRAYRMVEDFSILEDGRLALMDEKGNGTLLDVTRTDGEFVEWAAYNMWPFIKHYAFADTLKDMCINLFNMPREHVYGTEDQKNSYTRILWEDMPLPTKKKGPMTVREFMQYFGTDVMRKIYDGIWVDRTMSQITIEQPMISVISDCRFENEVEAVQAKGGKVIYLNRDVYNDKHSSENALKKHKGFDAIIDNKKMNILEMTKEIISILGDWEWLGGEIEKPAEPTPEPTPEPELVGGIHKIKEN
jgi:hypothetical protein